MKKVLLTLCAVSIATFSFSQNVGVDVATPLQKLDVAGAIRIGAAGASLPGSIQWTGTQFQFRDNSGWITIGANTDNQTLSLSSNNLSISGGNSVSLASYSQDLSLSGTTLSLSGDASPVDLSAFTNTDNQVIDVLSLSGSTLNASLSGDGVPNVTVSLDPLRRSLIDADGDTKVQVEEAADEDYIRFDTFGTERMVIDNTGNVGIGTAAPVRKLHIQNNATGVNFSVLLRNSSITAGDGSGIGFLSEPNGNWAKAGIYYERTTNFGVGKLHLLVDDQSDNGTVTLSESRLTILPNGNVGIGNVTPGYKLHVNGRIKTTGINESSDERLKTNVLQISGALDKVLQLRGVTYNWRVEEFPSMGLSDGVQYGLIAQELEAVIPELVHTDTEGFKSIEYSHLVPLLIESIKALNSELSNRSIRLSELEKEATANSASINQLRQQLQHLLELSGEAYVK